MKKRRNLLLPMRRFCLSFRMNLSYWKRVIYLLGKIQLPSSIWGSDPGMLSDLMKKYYVPCVTAKYAKYLLFFLVFYLEFPMCGRHLHILDILIFCFLLVRWNLYFPYNILILKFLPYRFHPIILMTIEWANIENYHQSWHSIFIYFIIFPSITHNLCLSMTPNN